jgi:AraC family transcriptional activator of tynA and feaB
VLGSNRELLWGIAILTHYSTANAGRAARIAYWNDLHRRVFYPLEIRPRDRDTFNAKFSIEQLGIAALIRTFSTAAIIERSPRHIDGVSQRHVALLMSVKSVVRVAHGGHDVELAEGDLVLTDSAMPSRMTFGHDNTSLGLLLPYETLRRYLPDPEAVFGRRVAGDHGFSPLVGTMLRAVWAHVEQGLPPEYGPSLVKGLLEVIATAYAMEHGSEACASSVAAARRAQIKRFIETHLRDASLSANSVATGLGLSARYTRMVFTTEGEGIADYILRRRLEECASQLRSALWQGSSITDTAFAWGFSSMAHFTRAFKEHFAVTPTEYRRNPKNALAHAGDLAAS